MIAAHSNRIKKSLPGSTHRIEESPAEATNVVNVGGCWPTPEQELLLRAALLQGQTAAEAWEEWRTVSEIDRLDSGSARLLPLVYRNLRDCGIGGFFMPKLKGIYLHMWAQNQLLLRAAVEPLTSFHKHGIETLTLKGAALATLYYPSPGLRPMEDFDLLVRAERAAEAINLLSEARWTSIYQTPQAMIPYEHACEFTDGAGRRIDLHWHALGVGLRKIGDDDLWDAKMPFKIAGVDSFALNPADQLLHVCVHGVRWNAVPPLRWVADALMIMRAAPTEIDWGRLVEQARKRRLSLPMKESLIYLRKLLDAPVPPAVIESLRQDPASKLERVIYEAWLNPHKAVRTLPALAHWLQVFRFRRGAGSGQRVAEFAEYLQNLWHVKRLWQLPFHLSFKSARWVSGIAAEYLRNRMTARRLG